VGELTPLWSCRIASVAECHPIGMQNPSASLTYRNGHYHLTFSNSLSSALWVVGD
jgi:hypothetical protein